MGPRPPGNRGKRPAYSLDRKNNEGGYDCGKCEDCLSRGVVVCNARWATWDQQNNNTRHNTPITIGDETMLLDAWITRTGISYATYRQRMKRGLTQEQALLTRKNQQVF